MTIHRSIKRGAIEAFSRKRRFDPSEREAAIASAAIAFFAEHGFDGSTRDLAAAVGVTQPLLYRYFPNKEALLDRVYQDVFVNRWNTHWSEELGNRAEPLEDRLISFYRQVFQSDPYVHWIRLFSVIALAPNGYS
nr:TetR/AcrR family transcriptional regulator [Bradyrhizobium erythrophlei]